MTAGAKRLTSCWCRDNAGTGLEARLEPVLLAEPGGNLEVCLLLHLAMVLPQLPLHMRQTALDVHAVPFRNPSSDS